MRGNEVTLSDAVVYDSMQQTLYTLYFCRSWLCWMIFNLTGVELGSELEVKSSGSSLPLHVR